MDRNLVSVEIMVDEEAVSLVDREFFHDRRVRVDTHHHGADHLAACRQRVENPPGIANREHSANPYFAGIGVNGNFGKMRA